MVYAGDHVRTCDQNIVMCFFASPCWVWCEILTHQGYKFQGGTHAIAACHAGLLCCCC